MRITIILHLLLINFLIDSDDCRAQNFIGMEKDQILQVMRDSQKKFKLNTDDVNPHYKYLKFENKIDEITILFFLSEENKCTLIRKMCDYSNINDVITELDGKYNKSGKNAWTYNDKGKTYLVNLVEEEWYFTVTTKLK
jgi:hypothetical protein